MEQVKGKLIALGGGDDEGMIKLIKSEICDLHSRVEVIATAATEPKSSGNAYKEAFEELGCSNAHFMHIDEEHEADTPNNLERIQSADVIFFTGGDQVRLAAFLNGTELLRIMRYRYHAEDIIIAGTSAGAAVMSDRMIYDGYGHYSLIKGEMKTTDGCSFIRNVYIDTHFVERGRFGRLAHAVAHDPDYVGIGLSEETGIIIKEGDQVEVFGPGVVTIIDGSHVRFSNTRQVEENEPIAVENLKMHLLVSGYRYCLREHLFQPVQEADAPNSIAVPNK
ncbi:cyanophycinase [Pontibacter ummariensis]|uniref:Cyanophycinase n=1 Tax=Pontibacter ummariensis TaxID=1610492 RepID=A0A239CTD6_9BACT|nr:cyanophycinase [Pontibacter ummariensis]PRY14864.1 cyanophycinase [Pontibacter ummariensis]SNS22794.1 cyanophycinase [Pontibacter ummariensis]